MTEKHASAGTFLIVILPLILGISLAFIAVYALTIDSVQAKANDRITVTTTEDELTDNGKCSLREAIMAANTQTPVDTCGTDDFDTIYLPSGLYTLTIAGSAEDDNATGDLDIKSNVTILGDDASTTIIDGNQLDRVFHILTGADAMIAMVTIRNGRAPDGIDGPITSDGEAGGAVYNSGVLTMTNCNIVNNQSGSGGSIEDLYTDGDGGLGGHGGGIYNSGRMVLNHSILSDNQSGNGGTYGLLCTHNTPGGSGGGLYNTGIMTITECNISTNLTGTGGHTHFDEPCGYSQRGDGSGIYNANGLYVVDSIISNNRKSFRGSGIYNAGTATMDNCIIISNTRALLGGGIYNAGTMMMDNDTIVSNEAAYGAGISNAGTAMMDNSTIISNTTRYGNGGGVYNTSIMTLSHSSIISNTTGNGDQLCGKFSCYYNDGGYGGGIYNYDTLALINCTISRNKTGIALLYVDRPPPFPDYGGSGGAGGGLYNAGTVLADNVTIAYNETGLADEWIDTYTYAAAGGGISTTGSIQMRNTLIVGNLSENAGPDCSGVITSTGYNLVGDISGCAVVSTATDIISTSHAFLFPLADNGGDTWTHALMPGSRAIDAGSCTDSDGITVTVDQRGVARPIGFTCDIGAYEAPEYPKFYLTVVMR